MTKFRAFISDLDGTLVNTEPTHCDAWLSVLKAYGLHFDHAWFEQFIGTSDRILAEHVIANHQLTVAARSLQDQKQAAYHKIVEKGDLLFVDIEASLLKISQQYPTAIATNSGRLDAKAVFAATGLEQYFPVSITADDVDRLKPAPDMYLKAAATIGVAPTEAIVCEDSPAGIAGAKAAGCYVIGITSSQTADKLHQANEVVADSATAFRRVLELLEG